MDSKQYDCPICNNGKRFLNKPLAYRVDGKLSISGEWAFHCYETHGVPEDLLPEVLGGCLKVMAREAVYGPWEEDGKKKGREGLCPAEGLGEGGCDE